MIRALTIVAAVAALVVSAAPVASAGTPKAKSPRFERAERATAFVWEAELSPVVTRKPKPRGLSIGSAEVFELNTAKGRGAGKVANLGAADDVSTLKARPGRAVVVLIGANDYGVVAGRR